MTTSQAQLAAQELQSLTPSAMLELYALDATAIGESVLYFHTGASGLMRPITFQGITYQPTPISVTGFKITGTSEPPRPKMQIANIGGFVSLLSLSTDDLVGAKLTRLRTWARFLDGEPEAAPIYLEEDVFFVERKVSETPTVVEFELATPVDMDGVTFPRRKVTSSYCPRDFRGVGCGFAGRYVITDTKGLFFDGAQNFAGEWSAFKSYKSPASVGFTDSDYGVYVCLSSTDITGSANSPTNTTHWRRAQRYRGDYDAEVTSYVKNDVVRVVTNGRTIMFICTWEAAVPAGTNPLSNPYFWKAGICQKFLLSCQSHFDPLRAGNPLPFGGFPGTVNLPTL